MKSNFITDKLEELYQREIYRNPIQTRPAPAVSVTGEEPNEDNLGLEPLELANADEDDTTRDLGRGSVDDLGLKGTEKDLGTSKKSNPKNWDFEGPRTSVKQED